MLKLGIPDFLTKRGSIDRSIGGGGKTGRTVDLGSPVNACTHINGTSRQPTSTIRVLTVQVIKNKTKAKNKHPLCSPGEYTYDLALTSTGKASEDRKRTRLWKPTRSFISAVRVVSFACLRGLVFLWAAWIAACASCDPAFRMMCAQHVSCINRVTTYTALMDSFPYFEPVCCVPCLLLTVAS